MGSETKRVALVTGGNRGLGLEACRQLAKQGYIVVLGARNKKAGEEQVAMLCKEGGDVHFSYLDVTDSSSMQRTMQFITKKFGRLDVLVNNAGILLDYDQAPSEVAVETLGKTFETNVKGPFVLSQLAIPLMKKGKYGRIVNLSSGAGQLESMSSFAPSYAVSKTALNAVTCQFAAELQGTGILVNAVCPGWVKTDMGGKMAPRSVEEGVDTILWAATLPDDGPTGSFLRDRQTISW